MSEELSCEQVNGVSGAWDHFEHDIRALSHHSLLPREGVEATHRVLEPDKLADGTRRTVRAGSEEILATVSIHIDPETLVVEEALLLSRDLIDLRRCGNIFRVSCDDENVSIILSRRQETIRHVNGIDISAEDISWDCLELVGPQELVRDLMSLSLRELTLVDDMRDVRDD